MRYPHSRLAITHGTKLRQICFCGILAEGVRRNIFAEMFVKQSVAGAEPTRSAGSVSRVHHSRSHRHNAERTFFLRLSAN